MRWLIPPKNGQPAQQGKLDLPDPPGIKRRSESLFGNGQDDRLANPADRKPSAADRQAAAAEKFSKTGEGQRLAAAPKGLPAPKQDKPQAPKKHAGMSCYHSHPPYPVAEGFVIYGGSGIRPSVDGCDVYVSLDNGRVPGPKSLPWEEGEDFIFHIKNFGVPENPKSFAKLIEHLEASLRAGKKVHVGCMAGHGRTGMVLAALRMKMAGDKDAIMHVRANYCDQVVETNEQIKWLVTHWGCNTAPPRVKRGSSGTGSGFTQGNWSPPPPPKSFKTTALNDEDFDGFEDDEEDEDDPFGLSGELDDTLVDGKLDAYGQHLPRKEHQTSLHINNPYGDNPTAAPAPIEAREKLSGDAAWYDEE